MVVGGILDCSVVVEFDCLVGIASVVGVVIVVFEFVDGGIFEVVVSSVVAVVVAVVVVGVDAGVEIGVDVGVDA